MSKKPKVDHKNPIYSKHFFENLSLAEKVRLQGKVAAKEKPFGGSKKGSGPWSTFRSDLSGATPGEDE